MKKLVYGLASVGFFFYGSVFADERHDVCGDPNPTYYRAWQSTAIRDFRKHVPVGFYLSGVSAPTCTKDDYGWYRCCVTISYAQQD